VLSGQDGKSLVGHVAQQRGFDESRPDRIHADAVGSVLDVPIPEILVIGDDIILEASMARKAGAFAGVVLTGTSKQKDVDAASADVAPELVIQSMTEFVDLFTQADAQYRQTAN